MSSVDTKHPDLTAERQREWTLMLDAANGESAIKKAGETYLRKPGGFMGAEDGGKAMYEAYQGRAQFPDILSPSLSAMVGIIHAREAQIEIPNALNYLTEAATKDGMPLEAFHRRITRNLLLTGRYGVLADAPAGGGEPFLAGYTGPSVINWDRGFYVLDETHNARTGFDWVKVEQYRVLELVDGRYVQTIHRGQEVWDVTPTKVGKKLMDAVPFAVANAVDQTAELMTPPLIGIARNADAIYQLDADYRHSLFFSGQETLIAKNCEAPEYIGAGAVHEIAGEGELDVDVFYVGPNCKGIAEHREAKKEYREAAAESGARMHKQEARYQESGEAKRLRHRSETATLLSVAQNSCALLEASLRNVALLKGLDPDSVVVTPPTDLMENVMSPQEAAALMGVYADGGMSWQTFYENLQRGGIASAERDHNDEWTLISDQEFGALDKGEAL